MYLNSFIYFNPQPEIPGGGFLCLLCSYISCTHAEVPKHFTQQVKQQVKDSILFIHSPPCSVFLEEKRFSYQLPGESFASAGFGVIAGRLLIGVV